MNILYGDNIFESKDIIIDRLLESIDNDIMLFENFEIINEGVIDGLKKLWQNIKDLIKAFIDWIKEIPKKIREFFNRKKKDSVVSKIKETTQEIKKLKVDTDAHKALEEKIIQFNNKIKNMTISFNRDIDIYSTSGDRDNLLYFITDRNKFIDHFGFKDVLYDIELAISDKDKFKNIQVHNYLFSNSDVFINKYTDNNSSVSASITYKGYSENKNLINYFSNNKIIIGDQFSFGIDEDSIDVNYFSNKIIMYYHMSYDSLQIVNDSINYCTKMYEKCNSIMDKIKRLIDAPAKNYTVDEYKSLGYMLRCIGKGISATKSDLNIFVQYYSKQYKFLEKIGETYAMTFSKINPVNQ